jgi:hypothetical protein
MMYHLVKIFNFIVLGACLVYLLRVPYKHSVRKGRNMPDLIPKGKHYRPKKHHLLRNPLRSLILMAQMGRLDEL